MRFYATVTLAAGGVRNRRGPYDATAPMWKVVTQGSTTSEGLAAPAAPYRVELADASDSVADALISHAPDEMVDAPHEKMMKMHRPTFGISLNELKAAIAPRARHLQDSLDETDRFTLYLLLYSF